MPDVKIRTVDELIESNELYEHYTSAREDAEATRERFLEGQATRQDWARCLIAQQKAWEAWVAHLGLEE
jgi:hypothetical protein